MSFCHSNNFLVLVSIDYFSIGMSFSSFALSVSIGSSCSSAASAAAKNGIKVALLEKEESVAQTVRTSGVTWIDYAKEFGIPEDCYNPIRTYNFCSPNNTISISDDKPKAAVLDVRKTFRFLADQAKKNGAEIFVNTNVTEVITENGKSRTRNERSSSRPFAVCRERNGARSWPNGESKWRRLRKKPGRNFASC